ncbi:MAG: hypothetical protein ACU0B7_00905 [Paracoccaceae bacterium]
MIVVMAVITVLMVIVINLMVAIMLPMLVILVTNIFRKHVGCPIRSW